MKERISCIIKTVRNNSIYDLAFLCLFFIALFIPMSKINNASYDKSENRTLSTFKPLINQNGTLNYDFGKNFEDWFNDRFRFRPFIYNAFNILKYNLTNCIFETEISYYNKINHFGYVKNYLNKPSLMYEKKFRNNAVKNFDQLESFCKANNIKLYIVISPLNHEVYNDKIFPKFTSSQTKKQEKVVSYIISNSKANVMYPINELKIYSKEYYTAYKADHHWTDYGAFIAYTLLVQKIKKDFPNIIPLCKTDFKITSSKQIKGTGFGRSFGNGNMIDHQIPFLNSYKNEILDTDYLYFTHKNSKKMKKKKVKDLKRRILDYHYKYGQIPKLMLMGTSVNGSFAEFLPYNFKYTRQIRLNGAKLNGQYKIMKHYKSNILKFKPDVLVLCITTSNLLKVNDWFKE